jgi:hypothetical protein
MAIAMKNNYAHGFRILSVIKTNCAVNLRADAEIYYKLQLT